MKLRRGENMKLYKVTMGPKGASQISESKGHWHIVARNLPQAISLAEKWERNNKTTDVVVAVELVATEACGLILGPPV